MTVAQTFDDPFVFDDPLIFEVMLSTRLSFSLCFLSLWAQRGIPLRQGWSGRIINMPTWKPLLYFPVTF